MRSITLLQPARLTFGTGCLAEAIAHLQALGSPRLHVIASPSQAALAHSLAAQLNGTVDSTIAREPTILDFQAALLKARGATCIVGLGGGSPLDVAKLVAALLGLQQPLNQAFGIHLLGPRQAHLVCIPTTSGTGSEVSPNAILLDEEAKLKRAVVSPQLVPDAAFIDPALTLSLPPAATASTGLDALTHCLEAFTNRFAHPLVDLYARQGIALAGRFLLRAVQRPQDLEAREAMALASLYGGLCLGPVNTAAVHALAYPLGGEYHLAHGLSNAILLPHVFRFNAQATPARHAEVGAALGLSAASDAALVEATSVHLLELARACGIHPSLASYGIPHSAVPGLAASAITVTRLLRNNPRELTQQDCATLYEACF